MAETKTTITDVIDYHHGWIARVSSASERGKVTLHLAFRNVVDKQHFMYAVRSAWTDIVAINRPATVNLDIIVPLGV